MSSDLEWRRLDWLPAYEISEFGDVRRCVKGRTRRIGHMPPGNIDKLGYRRFKLMLPSGSKIVAQGHRLVCEAFHGPRPSVKHQVAHWDGNPRNNHYTNLRWATSKENLADRRRHGTDPSGSRNNRAKLIEAQVAQIRSVFTGARGEVVQLARQYGMSRSAMRDVCNGRHWPNVRP